MAAESAMTELVGLKAHETTPVPELSSSSTPAQEDNRDGAKDLGSPPVPDVEEIREANPTSITIASKIEALEAKISKLEMEAKGGTVPQPRRDETQHSSDVRPEATDPDLPEDMQRYKKMEECLYKHRREWEINGGPGSFEMNPNWDRMNQWSETLLRSEMKWGPWRYFWKENPGREFNRPNPFDPSHQCMSGPLDPHAEVEYDNAINYGAVRDRLRKNFEWDMDRIFLAEEVNIRKRNKLKDEENLKAKRAKEKAKAKKDMESTRPASATLKLNRLAWSIFRRHSNIDERDSCVIDVLIGEPLLNNDVEARRYGFSGRRVRKDAKPQYLKSSGSMAPGQAPLPERLRIHSDPLRKILATIIGDDGAPIGASSTGAVVLVRPFKALFFCERPLRSWYAKLEKKLKSDAIDTENVPGTAEGVSEQVARPERAEELSQADDSTKVSNKEKKDQLEHQHDELGDTDSESDSEEDEEESKKKKDKDDLTRSPMALDHLRCILDFMDTDISTKQRYLNSPECRKVFFSDLWYLFRPGVEVIGRDGKQAYRVINVTSTPHRVVPAWQAWAWDLGDKSDKKQKKAPFSITCVYIDFDGSSLGPVSKTVAFKRFDGDMDITSLPVYPLRFHPLRRVDFDDTEWEELSQIPQETKFRQKLINRGAKFLEVVGIKPMYYAGPTLGIRDEVESQVVIDFESAFSVDDETQQNWKPNLEVLLGNPTPEDEESDSDDDAPCGAACCRNDFVHDDTYIDDIQRTEYVNGLLPSATGLNDRPSVAIVPQLLRELRTAPDKKGYDISDEEKVIMSYRVFGFVLRSRQWAQLDLSYLTDLHPRKANATKGTERDEVDEERGDQSAFGRLVLEDGQKPMIQSLVAQHFRDKEWKTSQAHQVDIVKGKGKGLILLLHGAPGVGKTSTAEAVAESFKKPLFQITCGDLGTTAKEVEKTLDINFTLANRWDCILLLDEADVFLAQRNKEDFVRNGLVAVFLRVLEYYAGVLFLTTNRVGDFDEAFTSRIHVSLYYPPLDEPKTRKVFMINLEMIKERFNENGRTIVVEDIEAFASRHFHQFPTDRWNGRQIRNACQTALALAEFEAQGSSHESVLKPDALVQLKVRHFEVVQSAYLEFSEYMTSLYGSTSTARAKESKIRAASSVEDKEGPGRHSMGASVMSKQAAFLRASQNRPQPQYVQPQPQMQQQLQPIYQQHASPQHQQAFHQQTIPMAPQGLSNPGLQQYQLSNVAGAQTMDPHTLAQMQQQQQQQPQLYTTQPWTDPMSSGMGSSMSGQGQEQNTVVTQLPTTPPQRQQQQPPQVSPAWAGDSTQARYAVSPPGSTQTAWRNSPSTMGGVYPPEMSTSQPE